MADNSTPEKALRGYFDALNNSDLEAALALYNADGFLALTQQPDAHGTEQLRKTYAATFAAVKFTTDHTFDEIREYGDEAFVRTSSVQPTTVTILATGTVTEDAFREFFIMKRESDGWKIDRYMNNRPL